MAEELRSLTADIVAAHVSNNSVSPAELPVLIVSVHRALAATAATTVDALKQEPAVSIRSSIKPDYLVSLESGKKMKMLKRYLMTHYDMTPDDYRKKWNLPKHYPMVAANYAQKRRELAVQIGLGRGGRKAASKPAAKTTPKKVSSKAPGATPSPAASLKKPADSRVGPKKSTKIRRKKA